MDGRQLELFATEDAGVRTHSERKATIALNRSPSTKLKAPAREQPLQSATDLLDVRQAAARLGLSKSTLDKMRRFGTGPRYVKSTIRAVRYDPRDLESWIEQRRRNAVAKGE